MEMYITRELTRVAVFKRPLCWYFLQLFIILIHGIVEVSGGSRSSIPNIYVDLWKRIQQDSLNRHLRLIEEKQSALSS